MSNLQEFKKRWEEQPMLRPRISSVIINVSLGVAGEPLERAKTIIRDLTGQEPVDTYAKTTWRSFGIRKGQPVGCKVTVTKDRAYELLMRLFHSREYKLKYSSIDRTGNFAFGLREHIDIPGMKYDPNLGIIGMDVIVQMERAGYRVKRRKIRPGKIGKEHQLTPEEVRAWLEENYQLIFE